MAELIRIENLKKHFPGTREGLFRRSSKVLKAVDGVSLTIAEGEILGLVGESGCGKSTLGRSILRLAEPTSGSILYQGEDITAVPHSRMKTLRRELQMVFQNPYASFNPRMTIGQSLMEILKVHRLSRGSERVRIGKFLDLAGLPRDALDRHPFEFSGGQLQRLGITRALLLEPKFIVADEPVSALDVSVQAQILNLIVQLKEELKLTILFIAHDLNVVEYISDRVAVMYLGQIVEMADSRELYSRTLHPYTKALMSAIPVPNPAADKVDGILEGDVPSPMEFHKGCRFSSRCPSCMHRCLEVAPELKETSPGHFTACHLY